MLRAHHQLEPLASDFVHLPLIVVYLMVNRRLELRFPRFLVKGCNQLIPTQLREELPLLLIKFSVLFTEALFSFDFRAWENI